MAADLTMTTRTLEPAFGASRGVLITVEGLWGAGKSTVAAALADRLSAAGFATCVLPGSRGALLRPGP